MSKQNTSSLLLLLSFALAMLCLFPSVTTAQKTANTTTGAPLKGVDVKLGKNPGGMSQARKTDEKGRIDLRDLASGSYWLEIVGAATQKQVTPAPAPGAGENEQYLIEFTGAVAKVTVRGWDPKTKKFLTIPNAESKGAPVSVDRIVFTIGPRTKPQTPVSLTIVRSKSNITNN